MFAGRLGTGPHERDLAEAARALAATTPVGVADLLLDGLVKRFTEGYAASVAPLTRALRSLAELDDLGEDQRWLWLGCRLAQELWNDDLWHALATRGTLIGRDTGRLGLLANASNHLAAYHVHSGALAAAAVLIEQVDAITQAIGLPMLAYSACTLIAARGDQAEMQVLFNSRDAERCRTRRRRSVRCVWVFLRTDLQRARPVRQGARRPRSRRASAMKIYYIRVGAGRVRGGRRPSRQHG